MDWFWQVIVATILVILLLYGMLRTLNWAMGNRLRGGRLQIVEMVALSRRSHLTVVRVDKDYLLLGVTDHHVTLIQSLTAGDEVVDDASRPSEGVSFSEIFANMAGRKDSTRS